jgi:hypothetical protein
VPKAQNLVVMGKEMQATLELVVLNYWSYSGRPDADLRAASDVFARGFQHASGVAFRFGA